MDHPNVIAKGTDDPPLFTPTFHKKQQMPKIKPRVENPRSGSAAPALVNGRHTPPDATAPHLTRGPPLTNPREGDPRWRRSERLEECCREMRIKPHNVESTEWTETARCYVNVSWRLHRDSLPTTASFPVARGGTERDCKRREFYCVRRGPTAVR
jgi:hypothetical protein